MKKSVGRGAHDAGMALADPPILIPENTRQPKAVLSVLAVAGIFGPFLFTVGFVVQGLLRTDLRSGYNPIAQQISDLTAGPAGWVQQVNFVVFGLLLITFAVGLQRGCRKPGPGWEVRRSSPGTGWSW